MSNETLKAMTQGDLFGREVRVVMDAKGEPWFVGKDVCDILDISKYRDALASLDEDEGRPVIVDTLGGRQEMAAVSASGLYLLILRSRKPEAKAFKRWITHEVLPSIRRTGLYSGKTDSLGCAEMRTPDYMSLRGMGGSVQGFGHSVAAVCRRRYIGYTARRSRGHRWPVSVLDEAAGNRPALRGPLAANASLSALTFAFDPKEGGAL